MTDPDNVHARRRGRRHEGGASRVAGLILLGFLAGFAAAGFLPFHQRGPPAAPGGERATGGERAKGGVVSSDTEKEKIKRVLERFVESWNANDASHAALVYTDPHFDVNATPQRESRQATVEKFRDYYRQFDTHISVTSDEIVVFGGYAIQRGEFVLTSTPRSGGPAETVTRRYVEVLRKDDAGNWAVYWGIDGPRAGETASAQSGQGLSEYALAMRPE